MSEQVFAFDTEQWKKLKEVTKENAGSRGISFCTDFTFCQNQTTYTQATQLQDATATYSRANRHTDTADVYSRSTPLVASDVKARYDRMYTRTTYSRYSGGYGRADYSARYSRESGTRRTDYSQSGVYARQYEQYRRCGNYGDYSRYAQVSVCSDFTTYVRVTRYTQGTALSSNLPSVPILLGTEDGHIPVLGQTVKVALFSYDRDVADSSDATLQQTYYDVYIQQIKDKYGIRVTGQPLVKLKSNVAEDSVGGGLTFDFDTTTYADGYYRVIAVARNAPKTMTFAVTGDASKTSEANTYYMQDIDTDSISKTGEYDGVSLVSGLAFGRGETNDPAMNQNTKDVSSGLIYDMYSISEVRIRQNHPAFFDAGIKNSTQALNMIFAGLDDENIEADETRGAYNATSRVLKVYGSEEIAGGDEYITLRGWDKGVVASIEMTESNTDQWVEVVGELISNKTGIPLPNSRIVAQFPTDKSDPNAYVHVVKSGGIGTKVQGYLYWPATLFTEEINSLKMEEYVVEMTVSEYTAADKATLISERTFSSSAVNDNGDAVGEPFGFKVDVYEPLAETDITLPADGTWIDTIDIGVDVTDNRSIQPTLLYSWDCGDTPGTVSAELYDNGQMKIVGTGLMYNYAAPEDTPWHANAADIRSIDFGYGVTSVGDYAFAELSNLYSVSAHSGIKEVGLFAFAGCTSLISVTGLFGVEDMYGYAFSGCNRLASPMILTNLKTVYDGAFEDCSALVEVTFSEALVDIGDAVFKNCSSLTNVVLPDSVAYIPNETFAGCTSLENVKYSNNVTGFGESAFENCHALANVSIPDSVTEIGKRAFAGCTKLENIELSEAITSVDCSSFEGILGKYITFFNNDVCRVASEDAKTVYGPEYEWVEVMKVGDKAYASIVDGTLTIRGEGALYQHADAADYAWYQDKTEIERIVIKEGITNIPDYAFASEAVATFKFVPTETYENLESISLPSTIQTIGAYAFANNATLTDVNIPGNTATIGEYAFSGTGLTKVIVPGSVSSIGEGAFANCESLAEVNMLDTLETIGDLAFFNCDSLTSIRLPGSLTSIGSELFADCDALTHVIIGEGITSIGAGIFDGMPALRSVALSSTVTTIDASAFENSTLESINLEAITSIGERAFAGCTGLSTIKVPQGVTTIAKEAFAGCTGVSVIQFHNNITAINASAFEGCTELATLVLPKNIATIGEKAFGGCTKISNDIKLPDTITSINASAFEGITGDKIFYSVVNNHLNNAAIEAGETYGDEYAWTSYESKVGDNAYAVVRSDGTLEIFGSGELYEYASQDEYAWNADRSRISKVVIADGITNIPDYAFYECASLDAADIPNSVDSIGNSAFYGCRALKSVEIPNSVTTIGDSAFYLCQSIESIVIPDSVTSIDAKAFCNCSSLKTVEMSQNVTLLSDSVFGYCYVLKSINIPDGIVAIGAKAFDQCHALESIVLPESLTSIGEGAFSGCYALKSINIPSGVTSIGRHAFFNGYSLRSIVLPEGLTSIGEQAFTQCYALESIVIPNSVTSIGSQAFSNCKSLKNVTAPSVSNAPSSYYSPGNMSQVQVGDNAYAQISDGVLTISGSGELYSYDSSGSYKWSGYTNRVKKIIIEDGITSIPNYAFQNMSTVASVEIPNSVTSIGDSAFYYCNSLKSIHIPDGVTTIGMRAFFGCRSLQSVYIPNTVEEIKPIAFYGCYTLQSAVLPDSVTSLGAKVFGQCMTMKSAKIPDGITSIQEDMFYACYNLESCNIPGSVTEIGPGAFENCKSLKSIDIPNSVTSIGDSAFWGNVSLKSVQIPNSVTSIGASAFNVCRGLQSVTIPNSITSMGAKIFSGCSALKSVQIADGLTFIGDEMFSTCTALQSIDIPDSVTSIGEKAFMNCNALSITLPDSIESISHTAFQNVPGKKISYSLDNAACAAASAEAAAQYGAEYEWSGYRVVRVDVSMDYWLADGNTTIVLSKNGDGVMRILAPTAGSLPSYSSADRYLWSDWKSSIRKIVIEDGITNIPDFAFEGMVNLTSIEIPDSVTTVGQYAFNGCSALESIVLPDGVTEIRQNTFSGCTNLKDVFVPEGVQSIGNMAFNGCSKLKGFTIPDSVTTIGSNAFEYCSALENVYIPEGVISIGDSAFKETALISIDIPNSATTLGADICSGCSKLKEVFLPSGLTAVPNGMFCYCAGLETVTLPNSVTAIGNRAFNGATNLQDINLPVGLKAVGESAFYGCKNLKRVVLPNTITAIDSSTFGYVFGGKIFYYAGNTACETASQEAEDYFGYGYGWTRIASDEGTTWDCGVEPGTMLATFEDGVLEITGTGSMKEFSADNVPWRAYLSEITSVNIDEGVVSIGANAFKDCVALTEVSLATSITGIGRSSFENCSALESVFNSTNITNIGDKAFAGCSKLSEFNISGKIAYIGAEAFSGCSMFGNVILPLNIGYIGAGAFTGVSGVSYFTDSLEASKAASEYASTTPWTAIDAEASSFIREVLLVYKDAAGNVIQVDEYSVANGKIAQDVEDYNEVLVAALTEGKYGADISIDVVARDNAGNTMITRVADGLNFDSSSAKITVDKEPKEDNGWYTDPVSPVVTVTKESGKEIEEIKIVETNSPTPPDLNDDSWLEVENPGREFVYSTDDIGQETGEQYIHVYVDDGLHEPFIKTIGPYKMDLESPEVEVTCNAIKKWQHETTVTASIKDSEVGSKLKEVTMTWYYSDSTVGGVVTKTYTDEVQDTVSLDITVPDNFFDDSIYAEIVATDNAGNVTNTLVQNIYLDTTSPVVSISPTSDEYPNWVKETIETTLHAQKEQGSPIKGIQIAEVKYIANIADVPDDAWQSIPVGTGRDVEHVNTGIGQDSGEHYLHIRLDNGIDSEPLEYSFGPYKVDLINPEVASVDLNMDNPNAERWAEQYNRAGWYWEEVEYRVYTKDDGGSTIAERKYQIVDNTSLIPVDDPGWIDVPWVNESDNAMYVDVTESGSNYIHTYLKDIAGNENNENNRNSTEIRMDFDNPVIDVQETFVGNLVGNILYGYANYVLKADDATSGVKVVKYAVTDNPVPPDFSVDGNLNPANFGRTYGWVDITDPATNAGYEFNLKAMGYSYIHVYVEDNAGRGVHTVPADALTQSKLDTVDTTNPGVDIRPSFLIGLTVVDESGKLIIAEDSQAAHASYDNIYALKNVTSPVPLKIDYHNYENSSTKLEIDIIDKSTDTVVKTITDLVKLDMGNSIDDADVDPYTTSVMWMDKNGQFLKSGLYEIKAKLYQEGYVASSVSTYVVLKQNTLTNPVITGTLAGDKTEVDILYVEDTFLQDLASRYQSDAFIKGFIDELIANDETVYESKAMSTGSPTNIVTHSPVFVDGKWTYETDITKQTTFVATVTDAFGNQAYATKTILFNGSSYDPDGPGGAGGGGAGGGGGTPTGVQGQPVKNIETPSANNYYIGFVESTNDTFKNDVFGFLPGVTPDPDDEP